MEKKPKIEFAQSFFEDFDGTQEELDALVTEIERLFHSGELFEKCIPVPDDDFGEFDRAPTIRTLQ